MRDDQSVIALVTRAAGDDQQAWDELIERYAPLVKALYDGSHSADIATEVTFEDGRKGTLSARVKVRDVATVSVPAMEKAA